MPGLVRGMARTAVVAGTATAVSNRVSRRQANRWGTQNAQYYDDSSQQQQYSAPADPGQDKYAQLRELAALKQQGVLSEAEFEVEKAKLLR
jgi:hypothetical protein